jgi:hypothetical protein
MITLGSGNGLKSATNYQYGLVVGLSTATAVSTTQGTNEALAQSLMPNMSGPCTAQNLSVLLNAANATAVSRAFTIRAAGASTAVTCTVAALGTACNSAGLTASIAANAAVDIEAKTIAGTTAPGAQDALFGWECQK